MARVYSRKKGKSGSHKPIDRTPPSWIAYKPKEVKQLITKLAKAGNTSSKIGLILRDSYGIPDTKALVGESILAIMKEAKAAPALPEDLSALVHKHILLTKHIELNKKDEAAKRGLLITESKIHRLSKYYLREGILPEGWKFDRTKAKLLVQ
ncbi:30S ribosomal protein S15 [Candidatus Woesearchaeota archaeon]|nr:30S ribosomal protein S15 [Candidatus Woesearchaeota archaeon]